MTGQFEWYSDRPQPKAAPKYTDFEVARERNPIRTADGQLLGAHGGHVPGTRRAHHVARDTGQEKR